MRWGDIAFGPSDQLLVSDRLKTLFTEAGLMGFTRIDPVQIASVTRHGAAVGEPPDYYLGSIQRSRAALDESASGLVRDETPRCSECRIGGIIKRIRRIVLESNTWSGEDVFFARGLPGTVLASERFMRMCKQNELANCSLISADDFRFDHYPQEPSGN
jgi:hypothetical protein